MSSVVTILEACSRLLLMTAVASGLVLAGGISSSARTLFILLSVLSAACLFVAMLLTGRIRLLKSPLWIGALAIAALGCLQLAPVLSLASPRAVSAQAFAPSVDRLATLDALVWLLAASLLFWVASDQLRTTGRLAHLVLILSTVVLLTGGVSIASQMVTLPEPAAQSGPMADLLTASTGLSGSSPWSRVHPTTPSGQASTLDQPSTPGRLPILAASSPLDPAVWFARSGVGENNPTFGGLPNRETWILLASLLLPLCLACGLNQWAESTSFAASEMWTTWEGLRGLLLLLVTVLFAAMLGWMATPLEILRAAAIAGMALSLSILTVGSRRLGLAVMSIACLAAGVVSMSLRTSLASMLPASNQPTPVGGPSSPSNPISPFAWSVWQEALTQWMGQASDAAAALVRFTQDAWQHGPIGSGIGTGESLLLATPQATGGLSMELGIAGLAVAGTCLLTMLVQLALRWKSMDAEARLTAVTASAALLCVLFWAGPGSLVATPGAVALGILVMAVVARNISGGTNTLPSREWQEGSW